MNNIISKYSKSLLMAAALVGFASCSDDDNNPNLEPATVPSAIEMQIPAEYQKLIYTDNTGADVLPLIIGEKVQLGYTLQPENVTYNNVLWASSDQNVVSVDNGNIEALSEKGLGYSIVSVYPVGMYSGSGVLSSLKVKVSEHLQQASGITLSAESDEVYEGETLPLSYEIEPESSTYRTVEWESSNTDVATVDSKGVVTGVQTVNGATKTTVTITAKALDGSGVTATKEITVKRLVNPEDITLDQTYASDKYDCAIADHSLKLTYTTYPADCTESLLEWSSSNEEIATVKDGVVTFNTSGKFGEFSITATCPTTGKTSTIKMNLAAGLIREYFNNADNYTWADAVGQTANGTSTSHELHPTEDGGYITVTTYKQNATKQRADFKCKEAKTWINPSEYPLVAVRIQDVKDVYGIERYINLDTSGKDLTTGTKFSGNVGGNNNKWKTKYKLSDGSCVLIYDLSSQTFGTGGLFPAGHIGEFTSFQFKYADIVATDQLTYNVYWVQTFKNDAEIKALIAKEGLTIK